MEAGLIVHVFRQPLTTGCSRDGFPQDGERERSQIVWLVVLIYFSACMHCRPLQLVLNGKKVNASILVVPILNNATQKKDQRMLAVANSGPWGKRHSAKMLFPFPFPPNPRDTPKIFVQRLRELLISRIRGGIGQAPDAGTLHPFCLDNKVGDMPSTCVCTE